MILRFLTIVYFYKQRIKAMLNKKHIITRLGKHFMSLIYPVLPQPQYKTTQQIHSHNEKTLATLANWWEVVCLSRLFHLQLMLTVQSLFNVRKHALLKPFLSKSYKWCFLSAFRIVETVNFVISSLDHKRTKRTIKIY